MATLRVNRDKCIKAGECYYNHPKLFKVDKEGFPTVLIENPTGELLDEANAAAEVCPAAAITVED
jgi:ferredoxin